MADSVEEKLQKIIEIGKGGSINFEGKKIYINQKMIKELRNQHTHNGGVIPLLALLPAILAGLGGAAGVASGIASTVKESKQARNADLEKEKLEKEILKLTPPKTGSGIENGQGSGIQNGITNIIPDEIQGDGIFLNPYEGKGLSAVLRSILKKTTSMDVDRKKQLKEGFKKLKVKVKVTRYGNGIFLQPYPT